jgi:hypothetical protein
MSPQNGGFIREFWLVPDSCGKEFCAVAGECELFFSTKFEKKFYRDLKWQKSFVKEKKPFQWFFLRKAIVLNRIYIFIIKIKNTFSTLLCKPNLLNYCQNKTKQNKTKQNKTKQNKTKQNKTKQNTKDQDKHGVFIRTRMRKSGDMVQPRSQGFSLFVRTWYAFYIYYFYVLNHKTFTYYANTVYFQNPPHLLH